MNAVTFTEGTPKAISAQLEILLTMSIEAEQQVAAAARLQLTWHYARLLTTKEHRQDALLRPELGPKSEDEVQAIQGGARRTGWRHRGPSRLGEQRGRHQQ
jgi:hypothetical protein